MAKYDAVHKQWESLVSVPLPTIQHEVPLGQHLLYAASMHGDRVAQINGDTGVQFTFNEICLQTIRAAQNLQKIGLQPRQMVAFMANHCDELGTILLATGCLACPIIPFVSSLSNQEIANRLKETKPSALFCDVDAYHKCIKHILNEFSWKMKVFTFGGRIDDTESVSDLLLKTGRESDFSPVVIDMRKDIFGIFCSSGTTGPSKAVLVPHAFELLGSQPVYELSPNAVVFEAATSIFWTVNINTMLDTFVRGGTRVMTGKPLTAQHQLQLIEKYRVTSLRTNPSFLISCLKFERIHEMDLSSVKNIYILGAKLPLSFIPDIKRYFSNASIDALYGTTEIDIISIASLDGPNSNGGGGGRLTPHNIVKIVDDDGDRCGPNETGEILVKKTLKFQGYLNDPVETASAVDGEGFFRTGDIGHFDDQGFLFITDRKKNIMRIYYYGSVILPHEIEEVLLAKLPDIKEVCVCGIPIATMFLPAVAVVRMTGSKLSQRDIFDAIAENFPERAKPRGGVYFMDELPKSYSGKLIRREISKTVTQQFRLARESDAEIQSYLADMPKEFRDIVYKCNFEL